MDRQLPDSSDEKLAEAPNTVDPIYTPYHTLEFLNPFDFRPQLYRVNSARLLALALPKEHSLGWYPRTVP